MFSRQKKFFISISFILASLGAASVQAANSVIDVLVVYTQGTANAYGGNPTTRINQLAQVTNQIYRDSGVNLEIRVAKTLLVNYPDDNTAEKALNDITYNSNSAFANVATVREQAKADMVIFYRPFKQVQGSCGLGWIGGQGTNGDFSNASIKKYMFTHIAVNTCGDYVTAHELGHNLGLKHSRKQDGSGGTFPYALGYGVVNKFTTIMAYQSEFNVDYWSGKLYKFSSPNSTCNGLPCGVSRTDASNGADAVYALNITGPQVANFYAAPVVSSSSVSSVASSSSSSSKSSVTSSSKTSSAASSIKSSAASSANNSSANNSSMAAVVNLANSKLQNAQAALTAAQAAVAANKNAIELKTRNEATALANLQSATVSFNNAKVTYAAAVNRYNDSAKLLSDLQTKVNAALSTYSKSMGSAKESARLAYNSLATQFNSQQKIVASLYAAAVQSQVNLSTATVNGNNAAAQYAMAQQATINEKSITTGLNTKLASAQSTYTAALSTYNAALLAYNTALSKAKA